MKYRKLKKTDYSAYEAIRKESLATEPTAFSATEEKEGSIRQERFEKMLNSPSNFIIGAFEKTTLVGIAGFFRFEGTKAAHKGMIWGVYVQQNHRHKGIGKKVVEFAVNEAWKDNAIALIQLGVGLHNFPAINLYANLGFESYGVEKRAFIVNGEYIDEYLMVMMRPGTEDKEE